MSNKSLVQLWKAHSKFRYTSGSKFKIRKMIRLVCLKKWEMHKYFLNQHPRRALLKSCRQIKGSWFSSCKTPMPIYNNRRFLTLDNYFFGCFLIEKCNNSLCWEVFLLQPGWTIYFCSLTTGFLYYLKMFWQFSFFFLFNF